MRTVHFPLAGLTACLVAITFPLTAQAPAVTPLMAKALADLPGKEVLMITVEYAPGAADSGHRHHAHAFIYVLEGSIVMQVKGGPQVTLTPGQTFYEGTGDTHVVGRNASSTRPAKFLVFLLKPVGTPVLVPVPDEHDQGEGVRRTELQRHDLGVPGREAIQVRVELDPGVTFGRHRHPGEEIIYVLSGSWEYQVEGRPPMTLRAGEVLFIPAGTIHSARNVGSDIGAELATYIVDKGKPLVEMVR